jgi:hypothetical protein
MDTASPEYDSRPRRVLSIVHDPMIPGEGNRKLHEVFGWNDPDGLAREFITDVTACSHGYARYEIVEWIEVNAFPEKIDGFSYSPEAYLACWRSRSSFHDPDRVDYIKLLDEFKVSEKIEQDLIDEVWLFAFPYAGYYESIMLGPGSFWCNAPPLPDTEDWRRRVVVMGFNYERGVGEMLENLGHRAEAILSRVFSESIEGENLWERFTRHERTHPGRAEVGTVHFAPNSERDYDWGNTRYVLSSCDRWYDFPLMRGEARQVNCKEWGDGDIRLHHLWWFDHFPHFDGSSNGISHNWWEYILDPNKVIGSK